ncbi:hypothetical protein GGI35DRAFT_93210 [Trichoderma velutinum]
MKQFNMFGLLLVLLQSTQCLSSPVLLRCSELAAECVKATTIQAEKCHDMASFSCLDIPADDNSPLDDVSEPQFTKRYGYTAAWLHETFYYGTFVATLGYLDNSQSSDHLSLGATNSNLISTIVVSLTNQLVQKHAGNTGGTVTTTINSIKYALVVYGAGHNVDDISNTSWESTIGPIMQWGIQRGAEIVTARLDIDVGKEWVAQLYRLT